MQISNRTDTMQILAFSKTKLQNFRATTFECSLFNSKISKLCTLANVVNVQISNNGDVKYNINLSFAHSKKLHQIYRKPIS